MINNSRKIGERNRHSRTPTSSGVRVERPAHRISLSRPSDIAAMARRAQTGSIAETHQQFHSTQSLHLPVACRRPLPQEFVRVHPERKKGLPLLNWRRDNEIYNVADDYLDQLAAELEPYILHVTVNQWGAAFLWPVLYNTEDRKRSPFWRLQDQAIEKAKSTWIRILNYSSVKSGIVIAGYYKEPQWPEETDEELVNLAFQDYYIDEPNHHVLTALTGRRL